MSSTGLTTAILPPPAPLSTQPVGTGLRAQYYDNRDLTDLKFTRVDKTVNFNWRSTAPATGMGMDTFSVRWSGQIQAQFSERYTFFTQADDGVRLWVNGELLIDRWRDASREDQGSITLVAGQRYNIKLEYYENRDRATCNLLWASASQVKQIVPTTALFDSMIDSDVYTFSGKDLLKNGQPFQLKGVNAMHVFGGDSKSMDGWGINTVREFIGDFRDVPISGAPVNVNGKWLHSLETIVQDNRSNGKITILTPFGWQGESTLFTGTNPTETPWWKDYLARYREVAAAFKNQSDVWFGVWNEPYAWDRSANYSDQRWLSDMQIMVQNIREIAPNNVIVVPGAEQGQDEQVILKYGRTLMNQYSNLVFDIHAYEKWLVQPQTTIEQRMKALNDAKIPVMFGEVGPQNAIHLIDPKPFLNAAQKSNVLAWVWKPRSNAFDANALMKEDGSVNDENNFAWATAFRQFLMGR